MSLYNFIIQHFSSIYHHYQETFEKNDLDSYLIFSVSDGDKRSQSLIFQQEILQIESSAFQTILLEKLQILQKNFNSPLKWAKLEWVTLANKKSWQELQQELTQYKRNYFRLGIAFPNQNALANPAWLLVTEMELNAHACLYAEDIPLAQINQSNLNTYLKEKFGRESIPVFQADMPIYLFKTEGLFFDSETQEMHVLSTLPRTQGRRVFASLNTENLSSLIVKITAYLAKQIQTNGICEYGYFPCFGEKINTYNSFGCATSIYALLEAYEFCHQYEFYAQQALEIDFSHLQQQIEAALNYVIQKSIRYYPNDLAYVLERDNEIRLGNNAVAILALVRYQQVFIDSPLNADYLQLAQKLANGILQMQHENGSFEHILDCQTLLPPTQKQSIYYNGEATFALLRLYSIDKNLKWLQAATHALDYFIQAGSKEEQDYWIFYAIHELLLYKPEQKYFEFAIKQIEGYLNFILNRITTFPALLELGMIFHKILMRLQEFPKFNKILSNFDVEKFYKAIHHRANYLINGVFFPEVAMHYHSPESILYSCFIRHRFFRTTIDDVSHYLLGWMNYHKFLQSAQIQDIIACQPMKKESLNLPLGKESLALATGGRWYIEPSDGWQATGVSIFHKRFQAGHLIIARGKNMERGYFPPIAIKSLVAKGAAGIICDNPEVYANYGVPILAVSDVKKALLDIARWVRKSYEGTVIGVTGSAGKTTTVAMLAHALKNIGGTEQTLDSANLPPGIAWNLSMMNQEAAYWVVEMAIGNMPMNSYIVQPDIAIITNIAPAHLIYHKSVEIIAEKKSHIFDFTKPKGIAVICRDIEQFDILAEKAKSHYLNIITYGEHPKADIRLLGIEAEIATISLFGQHYQLKMMAKGKHMVLNALSVLAVAYHRDLDIPEILKELETFKPVSGRGEVLNINYQGKALTVFDEAYNANPLSMRSALELFHELKVDQRHKVVILGDMLELGEDSADYHLALIDTLKLLALRELVLVGEMSYHILLGLKKLGFSAHYFRNVEELKKALFNIIQDGDNILVKASNGIGLHNLWNDELEQNRTEQNRTEQNRIEQNRIERDSRLDNSNQEKNSVMAAVLAEYCPNAKPKILWENANADKPRLPASLTKVLSLMLVWDKIKALSLNIDEYYVEVPNALLSGSSLGYAFFQKGEKVSLRKLMESSMIVSSNEAIYALAMWHSGSEAQFVIEMNKKAKILGMLQSEFTSSSGLIRRGFTTAKDMLTLASVFLSDYAEIAKFACLSEFAHNGKKMPNTNRLLHSYPQQVIGLKTGNLVGIGANLLNVFKKDGKCYISAVLTAESRAVCFETSEILMRL